MASRRTRLKAVINLPVRRAREGGEKHTAECPQNIVTGTNLQKEEAEGKNSDTLKTSVCNNTPESVDTDKRVKATEHNPSNETSDRDVRKILPPPKLTIPVRKRVKASVSLSALTRKPKEVGLGLENEKCTKDINDKHVKETSLTDPKKNEKNPEQLANAEKTSSITISDSLSRIEIEDTNSIPSSSQTSFSGSLPAQSSLKTQLPLTLHADGKTGTGTKVLLKSKPVKLTPRLVDSSNRRSNQSEVDDPLKALPSVSKNVADLTSIRSVHTPTQQTIPETDDELETSSVYSFCAPQLNQPLAKNTTAPSVTSTVYEDVLELDGTPVLKAERRPLSHRRPRKSGVGEILTVARRDFYKKFGSNTPDKKQLTMFDLIFYNPTSNPMKHENRQRFPDDKPAESVVTERIAEEAVDDVDPLEENEESPAMPAPQVKVGPDGSLIIDEKSLVIATTGSQKRKYELANSSIVVDYGLGNTTYNSFSKKMKPKEWSRKETLKFYRALQAVGTDFLLMKSIFPTRSRGDLKQKYKKEDRMNRDLIDKALRNPLEFNLTALEQELEQEGKENEEKEKEKEQIKLAGQKKNADGSLNMKKRLKRKGIIANSLMDDMAVQDDDDIAVPGYDPGATDPLETNVKKEPKTKKKAGKSSKRKRLKSNSSTSSDEESDINLESLCEEERSTSTAKKKMSQDETSSDSDEDREESFLQKSPQPTRYGRVPRARSLSEDASVALNQQDDTNNSDQQDTSTDNDLSLENTNSFSSDVASVNAQPPFSITSLKDVEPGSLVILSTPGQKTLQLFMVAPKCQNSSLTHIPVAITPEILASVNSNISGLESPEVTPSIDIDSVTNEDTCLSVDG